LEGRLRAGALIGKTSRESKENIGDFGGGNWSIRGLLDENAAAD
jgi:hypothetical protein